MNTDQNAIAAKPTTARIYRFAPKKRNMLSPDWRYIQMELNRYPTIFSNEYFPVEALRPAALFMTYFKTLLRRPDIFTICPQYIAADWIDEDGTEFRIEFNSDTTTISGMTPDSAPDADHTLYYKYLNSQILDMTAYPPVPVEFAPFAARFFQKLRN